MCLLCNLYTAAQHSDNTSTTQQETIFTTHHTTSHYAPKKKTERGRLRRGSAQEVAGFLQGQTRQAPHDLLSTSIPVDTTTSVELLFDPYLFRDPGVLMDADGHHNAIDPLPRLGQPGQKKIREKKKKETPPGWGFGGTSPSCLTPGLPDNPLHMTE